MLDTVTEGLEANSGIADIVLHDLFLVKPTAIAIIEGLRQVPVIQGLKKMAQSRIGG